MDERLKNRTQPPKQEDKLLTRLKLLHEQREKLEIELEKLTHVKTVPKEHKKRIQEIENEVQENDAKVKEVYGDLRRESKQMQLDSTPEILIVLGANSSGKTRLLRLFQNWLGNRSGYFAETDKLPDNPDEDWLFIDNPPSEKSAAQIENLAKGRRVILAVTDINKFKFSPKARVHILKIDGLDTVPVSSVSKK